MSVLRMLGEEDLRELGHTLGQRKKLLGRLTELAAYAGRGPQAAAEPEARRLDQALLGARPGQPAMVLLSGDAGIGKSTLAGAFAAGTERDGLGVLRLSCMALSAQVALAPGRGIAGGHARAPHRPQRHDGAGAGPPAAARRAGAVHGPARAARKERQWVRAAKAALPDAWPLRASLRATVRIKEAHGAQHQVEFAEGPAGEPTRTIRAAPAQPSRDWIMLK